MIIVSKFKQTASLFITGDEAERLNVEVDLQSLFGLHVT
jgi:hypothetical protein